MKRVFFLLALLGLLAINLQAQLTWTPFGNYTQATTYFTTVQPPINADGTSVYPAKKSGVVPVKFTLASGLGNVTIASTAVYPNTGSYGGVYTVPNNLTLDTLLTLQFNGTITGQCGGGSPRFQINYGSQNIMVYLGNAPNWDGLQCGSFGANHNFMSDTDLRFDTSQIAGGNFYDTLAHARTLMAGVPIQEIDFVVDAYWSVGDQSVELVSMTVNDNSFTFATAPNPTCTLPPATIDVQQLVGANLFAVDETLVQMPADNGNNFRVADCQYIYNLSTKQLDAGNYKVFANVNGKGDVTVGGQFSLK